MEQQVVPPLKSLATALNLVSVFANSDDEVSVSELSRSLGVEKSKVSRILATFRKCGWLTQDPRTKTYRVGLRAYALGTQYLQASTLAREATPFMRDIRNRSGFTTALSVLDGYCPFYVAGLDGSSALNIRTRIGGSFPIHATAPGRVLIAFSEERLVDEILAKQRMPEVPTNTPWNVTEIRQTAKFVRQSGFAISRGARDSQIGGIAVPVFGEAQRFLGALSIAYQLSDMPEEFEGRFVRILLKAGRGLSQRLGAERYPYANRPLDRALSPTISGAASIAY